MDENNPMDSKDYLNKPRRPSAYWALAYMGAHVFRQCAATDIEAKAKVRDDMLRVILREFLVDANIERALVEIKRCANYMDIT